MIHLASLTSSDLTFAGENLDNAPIVEFTAMIKALLALKYLREVEPPKEGAQPGEPSGPESSESARKFAAEQYDFLVDHAIEFCKDPHRSIDLKGAFQIQEAVSSVSKPLRRQRVVRGRKSILSHFRETTIGDLEVHHDFAFVANGSHDLVDFSPSKDFSRGAELRPDIIDLAIERLQQWTLESTPLVLEQEAFEHDRITWADVTYCCKLGISKVLERECLAQSNEKFNVEDLGLATIMTPGQASPTKQGFERTGTKPFMAIALLQAELGEVIQRRWAHDLESVIWCLAWYVLMVVVDWQEGTYRQVALLKRDWVARAGLKGLPTEHRTRTEHLWTPLTEAAYNWIHRQDMVLAGRWEYSDKANMELIHGFFPCPKRPDGEEWDWMDFKMKEEDIRKEDRVFVKTE